MKSVKFIAVAAAAVLASGVFAAGAKGAPGATPAEQASRVRSLVSGYSDSIVLVRYYVKKNAKGEMPSFKVPYKCPNCSSTHYRESVVSEENAIPAEFAGFLVAPDLVVMSDVMIAPEFIDRIEIVAAGESLAASEFEATTERQALFLKTEKPFSKARPLNFVKDRNPESPSYFFIVREEGVTVAGLKSSNVNAFKYYVDVDSSVYEGNPNTLVVNKAGEAVSIALKETVVLGEEVFTSPLEWPREPAAARFGRLAALEASLAKSVLPVRIQLDAKAKNSGSRFSMRWSSDDASNKNDIDCTGLVVKGGEVVVLAKLPPEATARLARIEATLPDGSKTPLEFTGSLSAESALVAALPAEAVAKTKALDLDDAKVTSYWLKDLVGVAFRNVGGKIEFKTGLCKIGGFNRIKGNETVASFDRMSGSYFQNDDARKAVFTPAGKLLSVEIKSRHKESWRSEGDDIQGAALARIFSSPEFDPENIPRKSSERKRVAYFGVETQIASYEIVREKKAVAFLKSPDSAALVTEVYPDSPAAKLGIKPGDILVSIQRVGESSSKEYFSNRRDFYSEINWEELFGDERFIEAASTGEVTPWPVLESGIRDTVAKFGIGARVDVSWVSGGVLRNGECVIALAPPHYQTAPRLRNGDLTIVVADMTREVRKYFKFDDKAPGVVISKVKTGGVGAVAGLRPLELIIEVNGEGVYSAKDFQEKTKGKKDLNFTVRRLSNTRVVPINL